MEVEVIGISADCAKHKTKVISRNSLNPIWNDVFTFQVRLLLNTALKRDNFKYVCVFCFKITVLGLFKGFLTETGI